MTKLNLKLGLLLSCFFSCCVAQANCPSTLPLKGIANVESCLPEGPNCVSAEDAIYAYMVARKDASPEILFIGLHGSPWHLYGPDFHILEIDELAQLVRQQGSAIKRVVLLASWSGLAPEKNGKSLAQKLCQRHTFGPYCCL